MQFAHLKLSHDGCYVQTKSAATKMRLQQHYVHIRPAAMQSPVGGAGLHDRSTWHGGTGIADGEKRAWLLCSSKCAVTTALHSHSTFQRPIGMRKRRSTLTPRHAAALPLCHSPLVSPLHTKTKIILFSFIMFGLNCPRARLQRRPQLSEAAVTTARPPLCFCTLRNVCAIMFGI